MSERLDKVKLVKDANGHWERRDSLDNIGISTFVLIKDAILEGRNQLAKDLVDYLFIPEVKLLNNSDSDWLWGWSSFALNNYGEDSVTEAWNRTLAISARGRGGRRGGPMGAPPEASAEDRLIKGYALMTWKDHRMGKYDGRDGFTVREYEDRLELVWDPCSSGGRMMRGDNIVNTPSRMGQPYNLAVTQVPHDWSWNKAGICLYCCHCAILHGQMDVDRTGYVGWTIDPPTAENPKKACIWTAYKNSDDAPEEYYKSLGRNKPPRKTPYVKPKNPNKLIRTIHSDEYGGYPYNNVKKAIDAGDKEEALKQLEVISQRTGQHVMGLTRWVWAWADYIVEKYGYNELYHAWRTVDYARVPRRAVGTPKPTKETIPVAEERIRKAALWWRSGRSGPSAEGSVNIIEEPDRFVLEMHPCGLGGWNRLTNPLNGLTSAIEPPASMGVTTEPVDIAWGKTGVPHYCTRCCVQEEVRAIADTGYLTTVVEWDRNPHWCHWYFYKDLYKIPETFYTRIGAKKPAPQSK